MNLLHDPAYYAGAGTVIVVMCLYLVLSRWERKPPLNIPVNPNYGEKTIVKARVIHIHRESGAYHDNFVITFHIGDNRHRYRTETGTDSYVAQYNTKPRNVNMVGHKRTPLLKYLELFDIKTSVVRKTLQLVSGLTKDDIEVVWVDKDGKEINWRYQIG